MVFARQSRNVAIVAAAVVASVCFQPVTATTCRNISAPSSGCSHLTCEYNEFCTIIGESDEIASCCSCTECQSGETMTSACYWEGQNANCTKCSDVCGEDEYGEGLCAPGMQRYDATNQVLVYAGVKVPTCAACDNATCADGLVRSGQCGGKQYDLNDYSCAVATEVQAAHADMYVYAVYGILTGTILMISGIYIYLNADQPHPEVLARIRRHQKTQPVLTSKVDATDEWQSTYEGDYFEKKDADVKEKYATDEWTPSEPTEPPKPEVVTAETNFGLSTDSNAWGFAAPAAGTIVMDPEAPDDQAATLIGGDEMSMFGGGKGDRGSYGDF